MIYRYFNLFCFASICGWIWEVLVYWLSHGFSCSLLLLIASYRGVLHGTWAPIYGIGFLVLVLLWKGVREKKKSFFFVSMVSCAVIEYGTAWILEKVFHAKWWDYSNAFLNYDGKICFVSVVSFGIVGALAVLFIMPHYQKVTEIVPMKYQKAMCWVLILLFMTDLVCSLFTPNMGLGVFAIE